MTHEPYIDNSARRPQALLYLRTASGNQAERDQAMVAQQHICTRRAEELGAVVVGEWVDFGSGLSTERPGIADLLAKLGELRAAVPGRLCYVIAADHARLGRSVQAYSHVSYEIDRAGGLINIASVALAEYEALMRRSARPNADGLPPPESS
ncbi:MAG TPA: recombinase family protein [Pseudonocardiaceae bacterium]